MPTYQYECESCGHLFEALQSMTDKKLKKCPKCAKMTLVRHIGSGSGIIFKGTGFYETDYKTKSPSKEKEPSAAPLGANTASSPSSGAGHCGSGGCGCASTPAPAPKPAKK